MQQYYNMHDIIHIRCAVTEVEVQNPNKLVIHPTISLLLSLLFKKCTATDYIWISQQDNQHKN